MKYDRTPGLTALRHIEHGFFGRRGGVSSGAFESLNVSLRNDDDRMAAIENRRRIAECMGVGVEELAVARQVHGIDCRHVTRSWGTGTPEEADALVTDRPGIALGVTTADCVPVLLVEPIACVIAAVHAGWRGALAGVTDSTLEAMAALGAAPERVIAAIGPCIARASYEVGDEVRRQFIEQASGNQAFFVRSDRAARYRLDLRGYLEWRLHDQGAGKVEHVQRDTYAEKDDFFSYRRTTHEGGGPFGLQLSVICLRPS